MPRGPFFQKRAHFGRSYPMTRRLGQISLAPAKMASTLFSRVRTQHSWPRRDISNAQFQPIPGSEPLPGSHAYAERRTLMRSPSVCCRSTVVQRASIFWLESGKTGSNCLFPSIQFASIDQAPGNQRRTKLVEVAYIVHQWNVVCGVGVVHATLMVTDRLLEGDVGHMPRGCGHRLHLRIHYLARRHAMAVRQVRLIPGNGVGQEARQRRVILWHRAEHEDR